MAKNGESSRPASLHNEQKVTFDEVYETLQSMGYIEKTHQEMLDKVKNSKPYKAIIEMVERKLFGSIDMPMHSVADQKEQIQTQKNQIQTIGSLALDLDFCMTNIINKTNLEIKFVIETIVSRLSTMKQINTSTESSPPAIRRPNSLPRKRTAVSSLEQNSERDLDTSLHSHEGTNSSVHTSDASSDKDEQMVIPKKDGIEGKTVTSKAGSIATSSNKRPKRSPKPNSRYTYE